MNAVKALRWLAGLAASAAAVGVAFVLYQRSTPIDFHHHAQAVEAIRELQSRAESLQQQVLAVRFGLLRQYDSITDEEVAMDRLVTEIDTRTERALGVPAARHEAKLLHDLLEERRQEVERFKSQASVLRNSLYYLPIAAADLTKLLSQVEQADPAAEITAEISALTSAALVYNLLGGRGTQSELVDKLARAKARLGTLPGHVAGDFKLFLRHAEIVSEHLALVDGLLGDIRRRRLEGAVMEFSHSYESRVAARMASANDYRRALYAWSVVLMLTLVFLGWRLRRLYVNLDHLVQERTQKLNLAMNELWGEMALARKIQTALLPASPSLEGFDIAAKMQPADQVGGDYYDVFRAGDTDWVLIGDVSGHGVPSGLVMMMCQTAMRTAIAVQPDLAPDQLLAMVNESLTENIRRLGEDRYVTCTAISHRADGNLRFSGMHQDLLVYRADSRTVERIEAEGMWLGIKPNILGMQETAELKLAQGDALLLYTDGVTEATRDGVMLDLENLEQTLLAHGHRSAQHILAEVLATLSTAVVSDDVAVVVLRRDHGQALTNAAE